MQRMNVDRAAGHVLAGQRNRKENGRQRLLRRRSRSGLFPRPPKSLRCPGQARCTPEQRGACAVERSGWGEVRARAHAPLTRTDTCTRPCAHTQRHTWARTHARTHPAVAQKHTHRCARAPTPRCTRVFASNSKAVCFVCSGGRGRDGAGGPWPRQLLLPPLPPRPEPQAPLQAEPAVDMWTRAAGTASARAGGCGPRLVRSGNSASREHRPAPGTDGRPPARRCFRAVYSLK